MTFKTAVFKFKTSYRIACLVAQRKEILLDNNEIFMLLANAYSYLANKHKLVQKYSTDNTTPQTNLVAGQTEYTSGTGATNIPNDIGDIYRVTLNDTDRTQLIKLNSVEGIASGQLTGYAIDKTNKILKLNASPTESYAANSAMRLIIHYTAKVEPYTGTATGTYASLDFTASDFGGSFSTDDYWSELIVLWALREVVPEKMGEALALEAELIKSKPTFFNYEIPYYNGTYEDFTDTSTPGQDEGRG